MPISFRGYPFQIFFKYTAIQVLSNDRKTEILEKLNIRQNLEQDLE